MVEFTGVDIEDHRLACADLTGSDSLRSVPERRNNVPVLNLSHGIHQLYAGSSKLIKISRDIKRTFISLRAAQCEISLFMLGTLDVVSLSAYLESDVVVNCNRSIVKTEHQLIPSA